MQQELGCAYIRISVVQDDQNKLSNAVQLDRCKQYMLNNNIQIFRENGYQDLNVSGGSMNFRPQFDLLKSDIIKYGIKHVVIHDITRLTRNVMDFSDILREFNSLGVKIHSALDNKVIDINNWDGNTLLSFIQATFGTYEREMVRKKVSDAMERLCKEGYSVGGPAPFGYKKIRVLDEKGEPRTKFAIESEEKANLVRTVFKLYLENMSYNDITDYLNLNFLHLVNKESADKVRTRKGSDYGHLIGASYVFNRTFTQRMISQFLYTGYMVSRRRDRDGKKCHTKAKEENWLYSDNYMNKLQPDFEPIISLDLWEQVKELRLKKNPGINKGYSHRQNKSKYLLSGMVICSKCKRKMHGKSRTNKYGKTYQYYYCKTATKTTAEICPNRKDINCNKLDTLVLEYFKQPLMIYSLLDTIHSYISQNNDSSDKLVEYNAIQMKISALETKKDIYYKNLGETDDREIIAEIYEIVAKIRTEIGILKNQATTLIQGIRQKEEEQVMLLTLVNDLLSCKIYSNDSIEDTIRLRELLKKFVKLITYDEDYIEIQIYAQKTLAALGENSDRDLNIRIYNSDDVTVEDIEDIISLKPKDINKKTNQESLVISLAELWDKEYKTGLTKENEKLLSKCINLLEHHKNVDIAKIEEFKNKFAPRTLEQGVEIFSEKFAKKDINKAAEEFAKQFAPRNQEDAVKEFAKRFGSVKKTNATWTLEGEKLSLMTLSPALAVHNQQLSIIADTPKELIIACKIRLF